MEKLTEKSIGDNSIRRAISLFVMLFTIFAFFSPFTLHLYLLGKGLFWLGGLPFVWIALPLVFLFSLISFIKGEFPPFGKRLVIGLSLILMGLSILWSHCAFGGTENFVYSSFADERFDLVERTSEYFFSPQIGGGIIGFYLASLLNLGGGALLIFLSILLLIGGSVICFWPLEKKLYRSIRTKISLSNSRKQENALRKKHEEDLAYIKEREAALQPIHSNDDYSSFSVPTLDRPQPSVAKPAVEASIIPPTESEEIHEKRAEIYHQKEEPSVVNSPVTDLSTPSFTNVPQSSLLSTGLQEAVFVPEAAMIKPSVDSYKAPKKEEKVSKGPSLFEEKVAVTTVNKETPKTVDSTLFVNPLPSYEEKQETVVTSSPKTEQSETNAIETNVAPSLANDVFVAPSVNDAPISAKETVVEAPKEETPYVKEADPIMPTKEETPVIPEVSVSQEDATIQENAVEEAPLVEETKPVPSLTQVVEETKEEQPVEAEKQVDVSPKETPTSALPAQEKETSSSESVFGTREEAIKEKPAPTCDALTGEPFAKPLPNFILPPASLLSNDEGSDVKEAQEEEANRRQEMINGILNDFQAGARCISHTIGPSVTRYNVETDKGVMVNKIGNYMMNISQALSGAPVRFEEIVMGQTTSGIEVASTERRNVSMKEVFDALPPLTPKTRLYVPFGQDISGHYLSGDLSDFPHMLVSGGTGSGKSVFMQSLIMTLIMRNRPEELKLVLVDPKRVEMGCYDSIPHLLCPIVKDMSQAKVCIDKLCHEMERRYALFEKAGVRKMSEYNTFYAEKNGLVKLPSIVCIIDEFADLMDTNKNAEDPVIRIAQKARAAGIHLIIATQRPTVDVVTGRLKANLAVRVALAMQSANDSMTILNRGGAEDLAGYGDMLVICPAVVRSGIFRAQGAFVSTEEIHDVVEFVRKQSAPQYDPYFMDLVDHEAEEKKRQEEAAANAPTRQEVKSMQDEELYQHILERVMQQEYASVSRIQREFSIGFPRAGKIFNRLQKEGYVGQEDSPSSNKGCRVLKHSIDKNDGLPPGSTDNSSTSGGF